MTVELAALSNFTFLTGASHPEEYITRAAEMGIEALAITDVNSVAGIVRAHTRAREIARHVEARARTIAERGETGPPCPAGLGHVPAPILSCAPRLVPATRLVLECGFTVTALPRDRTAWGRLCRLLSRGRLNAPKGDCRLGPQDLLDFARGMALLLHPPLLDQQALRAGHGPEGRAPLPEAWLAMARRLIRAASTGGFDCHLLLAPAYDGLDASRFDALERLAGSLGIPTLAAAAPIMHAGRRRRLADVLTAIRTGTRVDRLGRNALANAEQRLRAPGELRRLLGRHTDALDRAAGLAADCRFSLDELSYEYPSEVSGGESADERLERLARAGLETRYPAGAPDHVQDLLNHELRLIAKLGYAPYFLTVSDIVAFARGRGILCQGRGSAANSVTCYCLGVTSVSPEIGTMVFERFVSEARDEPPDIDVDFEHERREEVIQHIYDRYGRHRAGLTATVIHYRGKRAIREIGRAMGLSEDSIGTLSSQLWGFFSEEAVADRRMREIGLDPSDRRLQLVMELVREIGGFPRHLSQHVGGFVITEGRLDELVPVENAAMEDRTVICWDKDDIDSLGILKVDILALGMLTCIRKAFGLMHDHLGIDHDLTSLPPEDPATYDMLCRADSLGVFQVESRAQMNFLPRMKPRQFYDLVIEVAIIRPGPIQGDMVHPYIRRRRGEEQVSFPSDALGRVLGKTLGVPLFQEQAMQIAIVGAGFSPEEADRLRRSLATFKKHGSVSEFRHRFLGGMQKNGYDAGFAERCFAQIEGFGSYGFPESHAASFALLVYASAWLKCHHPAIFACALLNSQPMGFYAPAQIVRDAREHGVTVRPVCINASRWDNTLEPDGAGGLALRLGFRQISGITAEEGEWIAAARGNGYAAVADVWRRAGTPAAQVARLAEADAFHGLEDDEGRGLSRRRALWQARAIAGDRPLPLFAADLDGEGIREAAVALPAMSLGEEVVEDFVHLHLSLRAHPLALLRRYLTPRAVAGRTPDGPGGPQRTATGQPRFPDRRRTDVWETRKNG